MLGKYSYMDSHFLNMVTKLPAEWVCVKCGQIMYLFYEDEEKMMKLHEIEDKGMDSRNTCINCHYQRNPDTRVNVE